jgi:nucleoside-diphosphate-sugar epimerase
MTRILIAGAHGFLGRYLCQKALSQGLEVIALSGQPQFAPDDPRIVHLPVRLENPDALDDDRLIELCSGVEYMINAAGPGDPELPRSTLIHLHSFRTTQLLAVALQIPSMKQFVQVSSTAIAGDYAGMFTESMQDEGQNFASGIGEAFLAGEQCVAGTKASFSRAICRFGMLVGDSVSGYYPRLSGVYRVLETAHHLSRWRFLLSRLGILFLPFAERARCHLVPVDLAADAALHVATRSQYDRSLKTYHVIGANRGVSMRRLLDACLKDAGLDIELVAIEQLRFSKALFNRIGLDTSLIEGLTTQATWTNEGFATLMPHFSIPALSELSPVLLNYAHAHLLGAQRS